MTHCPTCGEGLLPCEVEVAGGPLTVWPSQSHPYLGGLRQGPRTALRIERQTAFASWLAGQVCSGCGLLLVRLADPEALARQEPRPPATPAPRGPVRVR